MKVFEIVLVRFNGDSVDAERVERFANRDDAMKKVRELAENACRYIQNGIDMGIYGRDRKPEIRGFDLGCRVMVGGCDILRYGIAEGVDECI